MIVRQQSPLVTAISKNDCKEVERLLKEKVTLEAKDFPTAFFLADLVSADVIDLLDKYKALPIDVSIHTLKYILYLLGNKNIDPKQIEGKPINIAGCPGLPSPICLHAERGDLSTVIRLMQLGVQERPLFDLFAHIHEPQYIHLELSYLSYFKNQIRDHFTGKNFEIGSKILGMLMIIELFLNNPTVELEKAFEREEKDLTYKSEYTAEFALLPFFSYMAANNRVEFLENKYFQRLIKIYPVAFSKSLDIAAVFHSKEFIEKSIPMLVVHKQTERLCKLISIAAADCNNELLKSIIRKLEETLDKFKTFEIGDVLGRHSKRQNPLFWAIRNNNIESVAYLLKKHVDPNGLVDICGYTYLHFATGRDNKSIPIVKLLLSYGAKINNANKLGLTPLHLACQSELWEIAKILIQNKASTKILDRSGKIPFDYIQDEHIKRDFLSGKFNLAVPKIKEEESNSTRKDYVRLFSKNILNLSEKCTDLIAEYDDFTEKHEPGSQYSIM